MYKKFKQLIVKSDLLFTLAISIYYLPRRCLYKLINRRGITKYIKSHQTRKLHIGCGENILDGWLNTDIMLIRKEIEFLDARKRFPFETCSFDYIFCEHLIEHLEYKEGMNMLRECFRILKPGGKIRISTPNLSFLIGLYSQKKTEQQERYISWYVATFLSDIGIHQDVFVINIFFRMWGHKFLYNFDVLKDTMDNIGFNYIRSYKTNESDDINLQGLESHGRCITDEWNELESLVVEGKKIK